MEVPLTPEQEARLARIAAHAGKDKEELAREAVLLQIEEDERFLALVNEGIACAERGEFIEEAEMDARVEQMLKR